MEVGRRRNVGGDEVVAIEMALVAAATGVTISPGIDPGFFSVFPSPKII
jgi:hypothetical protein